MRSSQIEFLAAAPAGSGIRRFAKPARYLVQAVILLVLLGLMACGGGGGSGGGTAGGGASGGGSGGPSTPSGSAPTVQISNLHDKGLVQTGFLVGTAQSTATQVSVSIDGGAYAAATGTTSWTYKLPSQSATWHDGSSHTIAVKATDGTNASTPVTITVRKGTNSDVNGDGYPDLAIGANGASSAAGKVYIFYSSGSGGITATTAAMSAGGSHTAIVGEVSSRLGSAVRLADINGDGYADLVAGASSYASSQGRVYVFLASNSGGGITATTAASGIGGPNATITGEGASDNFGSSIAVGDVNGDGFADLVVGAYQAGSFAGRTYIFHSSASGISAITATAGAGGPNTTITGEALSDGFGTTVEMGDVTGDGYADVVVGAPGNSSGAGRIYLFHSSGTSSGVTTTSAISANGKVLGENGSNFGSALAVGDITGDGYADVAVGAYFYSGSVGTGRAYVFHAGSTGGGISATAATSANRILTGEGTPHYFGGSVAIGDVNGDGYADLVVGAYRYGNYQGKVYTFHASNTGSGITATTSTTGAGGPNGTVTGINPNTEFSFSLAARDFNGDGYADVVTGALLNSGGGQAYIFNADSAGGGILQTTATAGTGGPSATISSEGTSDNFSVAAW